VERSDRGPDDFLAGLDGPFAEELRQLDAEIVNRMPGRPRILWEGSMWGGTHQTILGYGDFSYTNSRGEKVEWFMVGLAAQKDHISVYVNAADPDGYLVQKHADRLGKAKVGSAVIGFKGLEDVNVDELMAVVEEANRRIGD
jgi:hypothetical protein